MAWYQKISLSSILTVIVCWSAPVYSYDCPYVRCEGNTYCCGYDVCCFNYIGIWYVWVICFVIILSGSCCCYRWKKKSTGQIIIGNRTGIEETSAVIVNRHPHPSQYGAFGAAQHPYNWQYQQQYYTGNPPMYQPAGNAPVEKTPSAP